ncbi:MAG: DUF1566 domain-containing protein [Deltaproteobacteria bacterium]|nr:DUF1566 domain-containing protein [Deltaproteobacteria bacterium]
MIKTIFVFLLTLALLLTSTVSAQTSKVELRLKALEERVTALESALKKKTTPERTSNAGPREIKREGRFIANNNGTVLDTGTGLMWAAKDNGDNISWAAAKSYCENYREGGYTNWRMPTQEELGRLYDKSETYRTACGYDVHLTKLISLTCTAPWASETNGSEAAYFSFEDGGRRWYSQSDINDARALPVRSVK